MINFVLLIFVLNAILYKPIMKVIDARKKRVDESKEKVGSFDDLIEQKVADYEETLRQARVDAMNQREEIKNEGVEAGKKILADTRDEVTAMIQDFRAKIAAEKEQARQTLQERTQEIAREISEKVLGRSVQ